MRVEALCHHHIVDSNLTFPARLLWCYGKIIWLVHVVLVWILFSTIAFAIWVFLCFLHLDFISHWGWRLRILNLIKILSYLPCIEIVNIVFTSSGNCASWIWIYTSNSLIIWLSQRSNRVLIWRSIHLFIIFLLNINSTFILATCYQCKNKCEWKPLMFCTLILQRCHRVEQWDACLLLRSQSTLCTPASQLLIRIASSFSVRGKIFELFMGSKSWVELTPSRPG